MGVRRLISVTIAGATAVLALSFLLNTGGASSGHTCSALDKQFLQTAGSTMAEFAAIRSGAVTPWAAIREARTDARRIGSLAPTDPTLASARDLLRPMLLEYASGVAAQRRTGNGGTHMYRSYVFADAAHGVLVKGQPALSALGCDVSPLLSS